jgi:ABC-type transporter lipoprotein component MlaA
LLDLERQLDGVFDQYAFIRNAWLPRREYQVRDGDVVEAPPEDDAMIEEPMEDVAPTPTDPPKPQDSSSGD